MHAFFPSLIVIAIRIIRLVNQIVVACRFRRRAYLVRARFIGPARTVIAADALALYLTEDGTWLDFTKAQRYETLAAAGRRLEQMRTKIGDRSGRIVHLDVLSTDMPRIAALRSLELARPALRFR